MPNLKFSQFETENNTTNVTGIVGYNTTANKNIQITPANFINTTGGPYLPLAGGTMTGNILFGNSVRAQFGNSGNAEILFNGSNLLMSTFTGDFIISNYADDKDIIFQSDDGSGGVATYFYLDGGGTLTRFQQKLRMQDNVNFQVGSAGDMSIYHNGTDTWIDNGTGDLNIRNNTNDGDISFICDNGSGGVTEYITIDGTNVRTKFSKNTIHSDSIKANFGNGSDLQIYHDGSNSYIQDTGTGTLNIQGSTQVLIGGTNGQVGIQYVETAGVGLRHNNVTKLLTTSAGVDITGDILLEDVSEGFSYIGMNTSDGSDDQELFLSGGGLASGARGGIISLKGNEKSSGSEGGSITLQAGRVSTGDIIFKTGVTVAEKMRILEGGNVGVGTDGPANNLQVKTSSDGGGITIQRNSSTSNAFADLMFSISTSDSASPETKIRATRGASYDDTDISFITSNTEKMRIDSSGNVGIGTTSPTNNLQVTSSGNSQVLVEKTGGAAVLIQAQTSAGVVGVQTNDRLDLKTNGSTRMTIATSGDVGIGTTTPATKLHIADVSSPTIRIEDTTNNRNLQLFHDNNDSYIRSSTGSQLRFQTDGGNDRMLIDTSGNVGIGTTSPGRLLTLSGGTSPYLSLVSNTTGGSPAIFFGDTADDNEGRITYSNASDYMALFTAATERIRIDSSGDVGIGTTSPTDKLDVNGGVTADYFRTDTTNTDFNLISRNSAGNTTLYVQSATSDTNQRIAQFNYGGATANTGQNVLVVAKDNSYFVNTNVGIGTTSPSRKLEVSGVGSSASTYIRILGDTSQEAILELHADNDAAGDRWRIAASNSAKLQFRSNGSNVLSITSAGDVGIGNVAPASKLTVDGGDIEIDDSASGLILRSPDGTRYRVTVANGGAISASAV